VDVVDLAWLRTIACASGWPAAFPIPRAPGCSRPQAHKCAPPSRLDRLALLLTGWLSSRLAGSKRARPGCGGATQAAAVRSSGGRRQHRVRPGRPSDPRLAGVTVSGSAGFSLSLDRAPGGLLAHEQSAGAKPREWQLFGASRGEGGILGEGVRQR